jgi:hypothetical protein
MTQCIARALLCALLLGTIGCRSLVPGATLGVAASGEVARPSNVTEVGVPIDTGRITFRHQRLKASVVVRTKNPDFKVLVPMKVTGSMVKMAMPAMEYLYGNGLAQSADRVWGLYLDIKGPNTPGVPTIEMEVVNGTGTNSMNIGVWGSSSSQSTHSLTLGCRVFDADGRLVDAFQATKNHQSQSTTASNVAGYSAPMTLANDAFEDLLGQFFASRRVLDTLESATDAPVAAATGDFAVAKAATVNRRFVLGQSRETEVLAEVGPGLKRALPEGDAICYRSGKGKEEFRYLFDADGLLCAAIEISARGKETDWSRRLPTGSPTAAAPAAEPDAAAEPDTTAEPAGRTFVLVVGVNTYQDKGISALRFAENDARSLYGFYASHGLSPTDEDRVKVLLGKEATRRNVLRELRHHLERKATSPDDTVVFYFAGHGFADAQNTYLATHDTELDSLPETAIAMYDLKARWSRIKAGTRLFIADACHSGGLANLRGLTVKPRFAETKRAEGIGTVFISAAAQNELSVENPKLGQGVFTNALVNGLKGDADRDGDRQVSLAELSAYLKLEVPKQAIRAGGDQTPVVRFDKGAGTVSLTR